MKVALCGVASSHTLCCCLKSLVSGPKFLLEYSAKISTNGQLAKMFCTCLWNKAQKLIRWKLNNGLTLAKTKHWLGVSQPSLLAPTVLCITMFTINSQCTFSFLLNILIWVAKKANFFYFKVQSNYCLFIFHIFTFAHIVSSKELHLGLNCTF